MQPCPWSGGTSAAVAFEPFLLRVIAIYCLLEMTMLSAPGLGKLAGLPSTVVRCAGSQLGISAFFASASFSSTFWGPVSLHRACCICLLYCAGNFLEHSLEQGPSDAHVRAPCAKTKEHAAFTLAAAGARGCCRLSLYSRRHVPSSAAGVASSSGSTSFCVNSSSSQPSSLQAAYVQQQQWAAGSLCTAGVHILRSAAAVASSFGSTAFFVDTS